jgi:hypothetical protein
MNADLEKEHLSLKIQANALNSRAMALMVGAELLQESRALIQRLIAHNDKLHQALNEKENPNPNGGAVSGAPQKAS